MDQNVRFNLVYFIPVMVHTVVCYLKLTNWFIFFFFFFLPAQLASKSLRYMRVVHVLLVVNFNKVYLLL